MKILDFRGLKCPVPVLKAFKIIKKEKKEKNFTFLTDDLSAPSDFEDFCKNTGHKIISIEKKDKYHEISIALTSSEK